MESCCSYKEFIKELDYIHHEMNVWGHSYDLLEPIWTLKRQVKEFFPMNEVPKNIHQSLIVLEERMLVAKETLWHTCERIKMEVEQQRKKAYPDA
jgi:hypothetical protein